MDILSSKAVKTRKDHPCFGCGGVIPCGSLARVQKNVNEGVFNRIHLCAVCEEYLNGPWWHYDDVFCKGDLLKCDPDEWKRCEARVVERGGDA